MTNALKPTINHQDTLDWHKHNGPGGGKKSLSKNHKLHPPMEKKFKCQTHKVTFWLLVKSPADHSDVFPDSPDIFTHSLYISRT